MYMYRERKENAKKDLFSAILFYGSYNFELGLDEGKAIMDHKKRNKSRINRYYKAHKIIEKYIIEKWLK